MNLGPPIRKRILAVLIADPTESFTPAEMGRRLNGKEKENVEDSGLAKGCTVRKELRRLLQQGLVTQIARGGRFKILKVDEAKMELEKKEGEGTYIGLVRTLAKVTRKTPPPPPVHRCWVMFNKFLPLYRLEKIREQFPRNASGCPRLIRPKPGDRAKTYVFRAKNITAVICGINGLTRVHINGPEWINELNTYFPELEGAARLGF